MTIRHRTLDQANAVRVVSIQQRAQIRAGGRAGGAKRAAEIVRDRSSSLRFYALVRAVPGVGEVIARQMLGRSHISPVARVNSELVGRTQRDRLIGELLSYGSRAAR